MADHFSSRSTLAVFFKAFLVIFSRVSATFSSVVMVVVLMVVPRHSLGGLFF